MKKYLNFCALLAAFAALSACTGADTTTTQSGDNVGNLAVSYNEVDNTLTVTDGKVEYTYDAISDDDYDFNSVAIAGYERSANDWYDIALRGETSSGSGEVFLVNSTENGYEAAATFLSRHGTTNLPASGTASFAGDYAGVFFGDEKEDSVWYGNIIGDVTLDANFSDSTVSGFIVNRVSDAHGALDNVALSASSISNGAFSGTASGGGGGADPLVASDGTYEGMFTGADASEVIGSINIPMNDTEHTGFEMGIFIAEEEVTP